MGARRAPRGAPHAERLPSHSDPQGSGTVKIHAGSTKPAGTPLAVAIARGPEPPAPWWGSVVVSWRRAHWWPDEPTRRRRFDSLTDAVAFRDRLERSERSGEQGAGTVMVRVDVLHTRRLPERVVWIEAADDYQRPEAWRP